MDLIDLTDPALSGSQELRVKGPLPTNGLWTSRSPILLSPSPAPGQNNVSASGYNISKLFPRHSFGLCVTGSGDVYFYGGFTQGRSDELYHYSTKENTVTPLQCRGTRPGNRANHAMTMVGADVIALHGGSNNEGRYADTDLLLCNLVSREWSKITTSGNVPEQRENHSMAAVDTTVYIFGGQEPGPSGTFQKLNELWAFDLSTLCKRPKWELIRPISYETPPPRRHCSLIPYQNQLILFGGKGEKNQSLNDMWSYDVKSRKWTELRFIGDIPSPRWAHAAAVLDDVIYVTGGFNGGLIDVFAFKIPERRWFKLENVDTTPIQRDLHAAACIGTKIFIFGGRLDDGASERNSIHILDARYIDNPSLHIPERLEFDIELDVKQILKKFGSRVNALETELQRENLKVEGEIRQLCIRLQQENALLGEKVQELGAELREERSKAEIMAQQFRTELQTKVGELQEANSKLDRRVKEVDVELQRETVKAESETRQLRIELEEGKSKLERRVKELEEDNNALKRGRIVSSILRSPSRMDTLARLQGTNAQIIVDFLAEVLERQDALQSNADRRHIHHLLIKLAKSAQVFPKRTELSGVQCSFTVAANDEGGYGFIYKGVFEEQAVCIKVVRVLESGTKQYTKLLRAQAGELALLSHVTHPNVIPLYGAYLSNEMRPRICIVSPWMENGDLANYLRNFPNTPRVPLMCDIAAGLKFLHEIGIVHADLKARNVLVSSSRRAMLADFGISITLNTNIGTTSAQDCLGTTFWMAPEQLVPNDAEKIPPPTQHSDMWGFACICYEMLTGEIPFKSHYTPHQLIAMFTKGQVTPLRPRPNSDPTIADGGPLVKLAEKCWNYDPTQRPTATAALRFLIELYEQDDRPSLDEELAVFAAVRSSRVEVKVDYDSVLSIVRKHMGMVPSQ